MSKQRYCVKCNVTPVPGRNYVCGACRLEDAAWNANAVRGPVENIKENQSLARQSISGDRDARKKLEARIGSDGEPLGKSGADRVEKSVRDAAAKQSGQTMFQRLAKGRR